MNLFIYWMARLAIATIQALPLPVVARLCRAGGTVAWWLDARHRRVALANLTLCFAAEKSPAEIQALAKEHFRRLGESYGCAIKTASMSDRDLEGVLEITGTEQFARPRAGDEPTRSCVMAIGHFGNFELYARCAKSAPAFQFATTYRALRQPALNRLMQSLRERSGCLYFERRTDGGALRSALNRGGLVLGLLADQHAGDKGLRLPFFGQDCSTSPAPALLALRYGCRIFPGICYRLALARWRIDFGEEIRTHDNGEPRSTESIMRDINRAFEAAIRSDPANWFWVHKRWKPVKGKTPRLSGRDPGVGLEEPAVVAKHRSQ
jgi:KDO2-lipid IV(A) lauroyltransferase